MLKLEKFPNIIQYAVYTHPYRFCIYYANFFWESTNENANLSLGTGMGFSYCVHLIIKPKTWQFWVMMLFLVEIGVKLPFALSSQLVKASFRLV